MGRGPHARGARFTRLGEHRQAIQRAANALKNSAMYEQLGYDLAKLRADGIAALRERYSKSWEEVQDPQPKEGEA